MPPKIIKVDYYRFLRSDRQFHLFSK